MNKIIYSQKKDVFDKSKENKLKELIKGHKFEKIKEEIDILENHIRYGIIRNDSDLLHQIYRILKVSKKAIKELIITQTNKNDVLSVKKRIYKLYNLCDSMQSFNLLDIGIETFELIPHSLMILQTIIDKETLNLDCSDIDILQTIFNKYIDNVQEMTGFDDAEFSKSLIILEEMNLITRENQNYKLTVKGYNIFNFYTSTKRVTNKIEKIKRDNYLKKKKRK